MLKINLEGYQDPNVKDTYKILNKYVFLYIEIKCNSRQINGFRIIIHFRRVKKLRYSRLHERYIELNSSHLYSTGRCIGGDDLHSAETPFSGYSYPSMQFNLDTVLMITNLVFV